MGKLLSLVILISLVAVPRADATTGNRCRDAFVVVSAAMVSDETVVSTRFEDYRVERMKVSETKVSEADRARLYTALVKDESGIFGTLLKVFKHDAIKFSL
ncbi:MAG: hypothetical protein EOP06_05685 [Proteobacteria bacterium]|nr:MAG: hypothetical protein EOP06_05685 [Pseudomonadota bacterium]